MGTGWVPEYVGVWMGTAWHWTCAWMGTRWCYDAVSVLHQELGVSTVHLSRNCALGVWRWRVAMVCGDGVVVCSSSSSSFLFNCHSIFIDNEDEN